MILASFRRFWAVAARRNSSFALLLRGTSQAQSVELENAFEVREQHFYLLPLATRGQIGIGLGDVASEVTSTLVDRAQDLARALLGTAAWLERTGVAVVLARAVTELPVIVRHAGRGEHLTAWAAIDVGPGVVGEVTARGEDAVGAHTLLPH